MAGTVYVFPGARLDQIDEAIKARLIAKGLGTDATVFFWDPADDQPLPDVPGAVPMFFVYPGAMRSVGWEQGGGRFDTAAHGTVDVAVCSTQERDAAYRADRALNDDLGVLQIGHRIVDALQNWFPTDAATGHTLTTRGLVWQGQSKPRRHAQSKGRVVLVETFEVQWRLALDTAAFV